MTHDELVEFARQWCLRPWCNVGGGGHGACSLVLTEIVSSSPETPDVLGFYWNTSLLIECKTSRSDFAADKRKWFRVHPGEGMGRQRYFMVPKGLVIESELPDHWGLIEVDESKRTRVVRPSGQFVVNARHEVAVLLSFIRRLKIDPGRHAKIRVYTVMGSQEPQATATICEGGVDEERDVGGESVAAGDRRGDPVCEAEGAGAIQGSE